MRLLFRASPLEGVEWGGVDRARGAGGGGGELCLDVGVGFPGLKRFCLRAEYCGGDLLGSLGWSCCCGASSVQSH